jgi:hypothetical protein
VAGLSTFLAVTVPSETGGFMTDRARLTLLLRGGPEAELVAANGVLQAFEFGRTRPRDWPQRYLATVEERPADSYDARAGKFCFLIPHYEDTGQTGRVLEETRRAVEDAGELPAAVRPVLWTEAAYVTAAYENDPAAAREYLERAKGKRALVEDYQRSRAEAAILLAEGDAAGAFQAAERGLEELEKAAPSGIAILGREQLEGIKAGAQAEA